MRWFAALLVSLTAGLPAAAQERLAVDLELVLAVDVSRSMDEDELILQREGYASALEHPAVSSALTMGREGRAAILFMEWGGPGAHRVLVDWTVIDSPESAAAIASTLRFAPVRSLRGTSISSALERAALEIDSNAFDGTRRVVDVSGDGPNNAGRPVAEVRDELAAAGIEINGLPFMFKRPDGVYSIPDLDLYYEDCVIAGDSAFVIPIYELERLVVSIRQKLVLEVSGLRPPTERLRPASLSDCLMGEKRRRMYDAP
ncbi:DUF1194 domain-containing protein [Halovulum dunhuangense]|uniref:DUF1194 domain-containing protein n=1 Tax=Halovulum dunhuangense TaxID=1505036 RepID=A0A849KQ10_9RHOB|nr:DUF1194 domain-containing protein [Halovulum dunhuangense]NNU78909.1 DUF1194 domain-containing protein [Halovulum dunhuangense]